MTFRVGQKVVCVDDRPDEGRFWRPGHQPTLGAVYTVASGSFSSPISGRVCVVIAELPLRPSGGYRVSRFRPVVERKTDISLFVAMLNPSKAGVDA